MLSDKTIDKTLQVIGFTDAIVSSIALGHLSAVHAKRTDRDLFDKNGRNVNALAYVKLALSDTFKKHSEFT